MAPGALVTDPPTARFIRTGWGANGDVFGGFSDRPPKSIVRVGEPADTVMLAEIDIDPNATPSATVKPPVAQGAFTACEFTRHVWYNQRWKVSNPGVWPTAARAGWNQGRLGAHHASGMNVLYADYHAKFVKNPPEDCRAWNPAMPPLGQPGSKKVSANYDDACRPAGQPVTWCYDN